MSSWARAIWNWSFADGTEDGVESEDGVLHLGL
jgi:hypothetical protein